MAGVLALGLVAACATPPPAVNRYDFGVPPAPGASSVPLAASSANVSVTAPPWLDTPAVVYRLAYVDESQLRAYAQTQWVSAPSRLVEQSLKAAGAGGAARACGQGSAVPVRLEVDLQEFSQDFDTPQSSHVVLRARVRLVAAHARAVLAQRDFDLRAPAPSPDGPGAVHGLRDLAGTFATNAIAWAAAASPCAPETAAMVAPR